MGRAQGGSNAVPSHPFPMESYMVSPSSSHNVWSIANQKGSPETLVSRMLLGLNHLPCYGFIVRPFQDYALTLVLLEVGANCVA